MELSLTSGTDTSDLLGGFEQVEVERKIQELSNETEALIAAATEAVLRAGSPGLEALQLRVMEAWVSCTSANSAQATSAAPPTVEAQHAQQVLAVRLLLEVQGRLQQLAAAMLEQGGDAAGRVQHQHQQQTWAYVPALLGAARAVSARLEDADPSSSAGRFEWVDGTLTRYGSMGVGTLSQLGLCCGMSLDQPAEFMHSVLHMQGD